MATPVDPPALAGSALGCAALAWVHLVWVVPTLPEPRLPDDLAAVKPSYRGLATRARVAAVVAVALVCGALAGLAPAWARPMWWVWAGPTCALVAVDLATTFLPRVLMRWCALEGVLASVVTAALTAARPAGGWREALVGLALGWLAGWLPLWLVWRWGGGIGGGDVPLAGAVGVVGATLGPAGLQVSLLSAVVLGALAGVGVHLLRRWRTARGRQPSRWGQAFPYGPALWCGPWIALLLSAGAPTR